VRKQHERLQVLVNKGLARLVHKPRWYACDKARAIARALGVPWTREDDRNFRSPKRKKTKALDDKV
jgi:hypothetical protein